MNNIKFGFILLLLFAGVLSMSTFIVHERELAIKFKLGEIVESDYKPGLYFQIPIINNVIKFDSRVLTLDTPSERFLTSEKKNVIVNSFVKWRITDPKTFYTSTQGDERTAIARMASIINDELKGQIGARTIQEVISGERASIMKVVTDNAGLKIQDLGIQLVDVRVKKVELPEQVTENVYLRMQTERKTVAKSFRSRGEEQAKKIRANANRQREEILAESYRKSEEIRGEGDATAAKIYADSFGKDKGFYSFTRSLKAYENSFASNQDILVMSPDSEFFKFFKDSDGQ
jgi:membrane protease subunit HflC|tara:strand:- start:1498 stop:2364 length:867 start_codon:yes stop_codon:yes gene_type:complete